MDWKKLLIVCFLIAIVVLVGCKKKVKEEVKVEQPNVEGNKTAMQGAAKETEAKACKDNSECAEGQLCINKKCGTLAGLYACENKCKPTSVIVQTSDGQTLELKPGKGSYTGAGALEFFVEGSEYCKDAVVVPFKITRNYYGKMISQEYITVAEGNTSGVLTHPNIEKMQFKLTVKSVSCS